MILSVFYSILFNDCSCFGLARIEHFFAGIILERKQDIFFDSKLINNPQVLERPYNAVIVNGYRTAILDFSRLVNDLPLIGTQKTCDEIKKRGFAGSVSPDKRIGLPLLKSHIDATQDMILTKWFADILKFQHRAINYYNEFKVTVLWPQLN